MLENDVTNCETDDDLKKLRFNIVKSLARPFKDLSDAIETKLHRASRMGNYSMIHDILCEKQSLVQRSESTNARHLKASFINKRNHMGATALWLASAAGQVEAVKLLIKNGANLEIEDIKGQTPLYAATKFDNVECVKELLEAGANPDGSETNISTPVYVAARDNYSGTLALLIQYGADLDGRHGKTTPSDTKTTYPGNLPVYMTVVYRYFECFQQLVKGGADLSIPLASSLSKSTLLQGILRYSCDVRYPKLLYLSGGVQHFHQLDEMLECYRDRSDHMVATRKDCICFLEWAKRLYKKLFDD